MKKSHLLGAVCIFILSLATATSNAATITANAISVPATAYSPEVSPSSSARKFLILLTSDFIGIAPLLIVLMKSKQSSTPDNSVLLVASRVLNAEQ